MNQDFNIADIDVYKTMLHYYAPRLHGITDAEKNEWYSNLTHDQRVIFDNYKNSEDLRKHILVPAQKKLVESCVKQLTNTDKDFFLNNSTTLFENMLAGIDLSFAILGLIYETCASIEANFNNNSLKLSTHMVCQWKDDYIVPDPFAKEYKILDPSIVFLGITEKKGTGIIPIASKYKWYSYIMKIPRADGSDFHVPVLIAYKINNIQHFEKRYFIVCKPDQPITQSKDWTILSNLWEVTFNFYAGYPLLYYKTSVERNIKVKNTSSDPKITVSVKDLKNGSVVKSLLDFVNKSVFISSDHFQKGIFRNEDNEKIMMHRKLAVEYNDNNIGEYKRIRKLLNIDRYPFRNIKKEMLWELGYAVCSLKDKDKEGVVRDINDVFYLAFKNSESFKELCRDFVAKVFASVPTSVASVPDTTSVASVPASTSAVPASTPASPPASPLPAGGTKRYRTKHKKCSYKKRSYKKCSYKKRSYKKRSYKK